MGDQLTYTIIIAIGSILASSGFWMWLMNKASGKDASDKMLLGLAHDRILSLGMEYIRRGTITKDEYENLYEYLYVPYQELGGNGSAKRVMNEVDALPFRHMTILQEAVHHGQKE